MPRTYAAWCCRWCRAAGRRAVCCGGRGRSSPACRSRPREGGGERQGGRGGSEDGRGGRWVSEGREGADLEGGQDVALLLVHHDVPEGGVLMHSHIHPCIHQCHLTRPPSSTSIHPCHLSRPSPPQPSPTSTYLLVFLLSYLPTSLPACLLTLARYVPNTLSPLVRSLQPSLGNTHASTSSGSIMAMLHRYHHHQQQFRQPHRRQHQ